MIDCDIHQELGDVEELLQFVEPAQRDWFRSQGPLLGLPGYSWTHPASWFRQEYGCSSEALEGLVYPNFARCLVPSLPPSLAEDRHAVDHQDVVVGDDDGIGPGRRAGQEIAQPPMRYEFLDRLPHRIEELGRRDASRAVSG